MSSSFSSIIALPPNIKFNIHSVVRPATWRSKPYTLSYILIDREIDSNELISILQWAYYHQMPNPRVITPSIIQWSSLFHPRFFKSVQQSFPLSIPSLTWTNNNISEDFQELSRHWLQSVLFLSGITLSAAIIQNRFSSGTIGSKFDRLWDAGTLATTAVAPELESLKLHLQINALNKDNCDDIEKLLAIRKLFMEALKRIAPTSGLIETIRKESTYFADGRFEFIHNLREQLGDALQAVIVYGSSVSGNQFADIDAVVIVDDPEAVLLKLAGTSPTWQGKELNLGIYSPSEFLIMQRFSGDNLSNYGICIWGEVDVVRKPLSELMVRNFSFGTIRQRQQFGMLSRAISTKEQASTEDDKKNLYEYFVKIPANVAKGTFGAIGDQPSKEKIHDWLFSSIGFDTPKMQKQALLGDVVKALASSSLATGKVLSQLNKKFQIVENSTKNRRLLNENRV